MSRRVAGIRISSEVQHFFRQSAVSWLLFRILEQREVNIMSSIGVNKVILLGNAGQNAELRSTSGGKPVANFSLAIHQPFRNNKDGKQRVEWVRCVAWDKLAQIAEKLVTKGTVVFVEGRLQTRKFENREGATNTVTEVVVASLRTLGETKTLSSFSEHPAEANSDDSETETVPF